MGSGVALAIKNKWPIVYESYMDMPSGKEMLGQTHIIHVAEGLYVANCYTQLNYGYDRVKYADVDSVKECVRSCYNFADSNEYTISTPLIGSDRGGLDWDTEVEPIFLALNIEYPDMKINVYNI